MDEPRKTYHPPQVVEYGDLDTLTLAGGGVNTDQNQGSLLG